MHLSLPTHRVAFRLSLVTLPADAPANTIPFCFSVVFLDLVCVWFLLRPMCLTLLLLLVFCLLLLS